MITPIQGRLLVELKGKYQHIEASAERFGTQRTRGIVRAIAAGLTEDDLQGIEVGSVVYFGKYEDNVEAQIDGKDAALIKLEEIGGYEND